MADQRSPAKPYHVSSPTASASGGTSPDFPEVSTSRGVNNNLDGDRDPFQDPPPQYQKEEELPTGWKKEWSAEHERFYYVDTLANPPRCGIAIWVHPFEDPEFLASIPDPDALNSSRHVEAGQRSQPQRGRSNSWGHSDLSATTATTAHQHAPSSSLSPADAQASSGHKRSRSAMGKFKDSIIGTKEEREERRRQREAQEREYERALEERRREYERQRRVLELQRREAEIQRREAIASQPQPQVVYVQQRPAFYGPPPITAFGYRRSPYSVGYGGGRHGYGTGPGYRRGIGGGFGGAGLPLLGGLAGGLLLGEALGDFGD